MAIINIKIGYRPPNAEDDPYTQDTTKYQHVFKYNHIEKNSVSK
jgi:hypothetical protein